MPDSLAAVRSRIDQFLACLSECLCFSVISSRGFAFTGNCQYFTINSRLYLGKISKWSDVPAITDVNVILFDQFSKNK